YQVPIHIWASSSIPFQFIVIITREHFIGGERTKYTSTSGSSHSIWIPLVLTYDITLRHSITTYHWYKSEV
ncbi:hypothetical protein ACJX0J_021875, partial [Zea mays]